MTKRGGNKPQSLEGIIYKSKTIDYNNNDNNYNNHESQLPSCDAVSPRFSTIDPNSTTDIFRRNKYLNNFVIEERDEREESEYCDETDEENEDAPESCLTESEDDHGLTEIDEDADDENSADT